MRIDRVKREFTKPRQRRREKRRLKNKLMFHLRISGYCLKSFTLFIAVKTMPKLNRKHSDKI